MLYDFAFGSRNGPLLRLYRRKKIIDREAAGRYRVRTCKIPQRKAKAADGAAKGELLGIFGRDFQGDGLGDHWLVLLVLVVLVVVVVCGPLIYAEHLDVLQQHVGLRMIGSREQH